MPIEPTLNAILKEMWRIDEKRSSGERIEENERVFFNANLGTIQKYYADNSEHWKHKTIA